MSDKILFDCLCDRCGKSIIISDDILKIYDEIPNHRCETEAVPEQKPEPKKAKAWKMPKLPKIKGVKK